MNYEPLIERELDAIPAAAHAFLETHSAEELWISVTRFAVLAYAPSQHAKRAVMACRATWDVREELGDRWVEMIVECARYAAEARQPWSEPPMLEPPDPSSDDLQTALRSGDRLTAERWLSAHLPDAEVLLREVAHGDALLMLDTALALLPRLGEKGRYALLRMPLWELLADPSSVDDDAPLSTLIARAVEQNGAIDAVRAVFVKWSGGLQPADAAGGLKPAAPLNQYPLARDYAQTLIAHSVALSLPRADGESLLHAVHHNLEHGDSYADWSFA